MPEKIELTPTELRVLVSPNWVARAAAGATQDAAQRWLLRQPREVRRAFYDEVIVRGGGEVIAQERWLLLAPEAVRRAYVDQVLD